MIEVDLNTCIKGGSAVSYLSKLDLPIGIYIRGCSEYTALGLVCETKLGKRFSKLLTTQLKRNMSDTTV